MWTVTGGRYGRHTATPAVARDQPPCPDHQRYGRHGAVLRRRARRPADRHDRPSRVPPLLLRDRHRELGGVLRVHEPRGRAVREASRRAPPARRAVRPPVVRARRRRSAARTARTTEERQLRGHRRGRPRVHPVDLLHRPERHRARSLVVDVRPHGSRRVVGERRPRVRRFQPRTRRARAPRRRPATRPRHQTRRRLHRQTRRLGDSPRETKALVRCELGT
jgi:hypothetical protein